MDYSFTDEPRETGMNWIFFCDVFAGAVDVASLVLTAARVPRNSHKAPFDS